MSPAPVTAPPRRYPLSRVALDELARRTGTPLPWGRARPSRAATALGPAPGPASAQAPASADNPVGDLTRLGLLSGGGEVDTDTAEALAVFGRPEVFVDLELAVRGPAGQAEMARLSAWHRHRSGLVTAVTTTGASCELAWWPAARWSAELTRLATPRDVASGAAPAARLRLPFDLLLGSATALREDRPGVAAELLERSRGRVRGPDDAAYDTVAAGDQVRLLHTAERGRLRVIVVGRGRTVGLVSWVLFADGWRELTPALDDGEPMVDVRRVVPADLARAVGRLASGGRS
jgi:hypothetical protein